MASDRHAQRQTVVRLPDPVWEKLQQAAEDHSVSVNWLIVKGITEFLNHLIPAEEMKWTR